VFFYSSSPRTASVGALLLSLAAACSDRPTEPASPRGPALARARTSGGASYAAAWAGGITFRFYTPQSSGLFEVIAGSGTGGRFVVADRGCAIPLAPGQSCPSNRRVVGYTDRVARGEAYHTSTRGYGATDEFGVLVGGSVVSWSYGVPLPSYVQRTVPTDPSADNVAVFATQHGYYYSQGLPIGRR
jgi:hypothetical protein